MICWRLACKGRCGRCFPYPGLRVFAGEAEGDGGRALGGGGEVFIAGGFGVDAFGVVVGGAFIPPVFGSTGGFAPPCFGTVAGTPAFGTEPCTPGFCTSSGG